MTNEFVFGYTFIGFPNVFEDPSKVSPSKVGFNYKLLYKNGVDQIPNFGGGSEARRRGGFRQARRLDDHHQRLHGRDRQLLFPADGGR